MASSGTTSTRKRFTGAEFIVHFLEQQGIKIVTGIPGGSILPVYDALSQSTQIRHILARHEQGAGFIAQGRFMYRAYSPKGRKSKVDPRVLFKVMVYGYQCGIYSSRKKRAGIE